MTCSSPPNSQRKNDVLQSSPYPLKPQLQKESPRGNTLTYTLQSQKSKRPHSHLPINAQVDGFLMKRSSRRRKLTLHSQCHCLQHYFFRNEDRRWHKSRYSAGSPEELRFKISGSVMAERAVGAGSSLLNMITPEPLGSAFGGRLVKVSSEDVLGKARRTILAAESCGRLDHLMDALDSLLTEYKVQEGRGDPMDFRNPAVVRTKGRMSNKEKRRTSAMVIPPKKTKKQRRATVCSRCGQAGHNKANRKKCRLHPSYKEEK